MLHKGNGLPHSDEDDGDYEDLLDGDFFASQSEKDERLVTWKSNSPGVIRRILQNRPKVPRTDNIPEIVKTLTRNIKPRSPTPPRIPLRLPPPENVKKSPLPLGRRLQRCKKPSHEKILESVAKQLQKRMRDEGMLGESSTLEDASKDSEKASRGDLGGKEEKEEDETVGETSSQPFENSMLGEKGSDVSWSDDDLYKSQAFIDMATQVEVAALGMEPRHSGCPKRLFQNSLPPDNAAGGSSSPESSSPPLSVPWERPQAAVEAGSSQMPVQGTSFSLSNDSEIIPPTYMEVACHPKTPTVRRSERLRNISPTFSPCGRTVAKSPCVTPAKATRPVTPTTTTSHPLGPFGSPNITEDLLMMFAEEDEELNLAACSFTSVNGSGSKAAVPTSSTVPSSRSSSDKAKGSFKEPSPKSRYNFRKSTGTVSAAATSSLRTYGGPTMPNASTRSAPGPPSSSFGNEENTSDSVLKPSSIQEKRQALRPYVQSVNRKSSSSPGNPGTPKSTRIRQAPLSGLEAASRHLIADRNSSGPASTPCKVARMGKSQCAVQGTKESVPAGGQTTATTAAAGGQGGGGGTSTRGSAGKASSSPVPRSAKPADVSCTASASALRPADEEEFMMDDAMYGPEFLAAVEAIEASVARSSSPKLAAPVKQSYCSQEQIERKKQEALKRREKSRLRLGKR